VNQVDIIIVNYNSMDYLVNCLDSVYGCLGDGIDATVHVADNGSTDNLEVLSERFPHLALTENKTNAGFAKAVNQHIARSAAPYILILNPDTVIKAGFFESMLKFMEENPRVGIAGPRVFEGNGSIQGSARSFPTPLTGLFGRSTIMTRLFPGNRLTAKNILINNGDGEKPVAVDWVSGACMLVRREAVEDVGLMDERFFMYWEDADWCRRMSEKGWSVVYCPQASVVHYVGRSSGRGIRPLLEFHRSAHYFYCKYCRSKGAGVAKVLVFWVLSLRFYVLLAERCLCRVGRDRAKPFSGDRRDPAGG